ncbi:hypothetical protein Ancab_034870 [Ancistrocladus abbreviatus]
MASQSSSSSGKKTIILKSSDKEEFVVEEKVAVQSETIKRIIDDDCVGDFIPLPNVDAKTLAKVIEYCKKHSEDVPEEHLKTWDAEIFLNEPRDVIMALILAANYLEVKDLLDLTCQRIADAIKNLSVEQVREFFNIENDFTPEEEAAIRKEYSWAHEDIDKD